MAYYCYFAFRVLRGQIITGDSALLIVATRDTKRVRSTLLGEFAFLDDEIMAIPAAS